MPTLMKDARPANEAKKCDAPGCPNLRKNISRFCWTHEQRWKLHGNPHGRRIKRQEYLVELDEVQRVIGKNLDHVAVQEALRLLDVWLVQANNGNTTLPAHEEFSRLYTAGVTAQRLLEEVAAVWLYLKRNAHGFDDGRQLTYALGTAVLYIVPRQRKASASNPAKLTGYFVVNGKMRRETGEVLRKYLGPLLDNIAERINRDYEMEENRKKNLWTPL